MENRDNSNNTNNICKKIPNTKTLEEISEHLATEILEHLAKEISEHLAKEISEHLAKEVSDENAGHVLHRGVRVPNRVRLLMSAGNGVCGMSGGASIWGGWGGQ